MMTERGSIEIREEEEGVIAANRTVKGKGNLEEKVLSNIEAKFRNPSSTHTCIFRISDRMKKVNETEFVPRLVSIGPLHHCKKSLQAMEAIKYWYLHNLLQKASCRTNLKHMVEIVTSMEEYCRDCYDENLDLSSEAFVEMMVIDGCFIIEFYREMAGEFFTMENMLLHAIEGPDFPRSVAASDLLLLENQLPWGVVECLFELTKEPNQERSCNYLTELCGRVWRDPVETVVCGRPLGIVEEKSRSRHLLDTWRLFSSGPDHICEVYSWFSLPSSATELLQIGVKFIRRRSDDNILIVTFVNGVMEISPIFGKPFHLLRNLVFMEECDSTGPHQYKITSYCRIMNDLIKSTKDVELLIEKGILPRVGINNEELASFFNDICNNTVTTSSYSASFVEISRSVWLYYKRHWVWRWIAWIKHDYLHNPSSIWSVSNAVVLVIILTAIRTIYSVLSYYKST